MAFILHPTFKGSGHLYITQDNITESYRDKGSKFVGYLFPAETESRFEEKLDEVKSEHPRATHHCYGWRIDPNNLREYAQDDGEPAGTAGQPILNRLKSHELVNAGLVVARYYGGTNLGTSGLIDAYGKTAGLCLEKCNRKEIVPATSLRITYPYPQQKHIDRLAASHRIRERDAEYLEKVTLVVDCPADLVGDLTDHLDRMEHLDISYEELGESYIIKKG